MKAFAWHEGDSILHRLNPLTKLGACFMAAAAVSTANEPLTPSVIVLMALLITRLVGQVPVALLARPLVFGVMAGAGIFWTYAVFAANGPDWRYGAAMATRLLAILSTSAMFVLTSDPSQFVRSLIHQARVSPRIAYAVFAGYRFIPLLEVEFETIRSAHQMRGGVGRGGALDRARELIGYAIPLLASAVRKGERVALAMESRAFGARPARTYYRVTSFGAADVVFLVASLAVLAADVGLRRYVS